jgi:hypothetical protein
MRKSSWALAVGAGVVAVAAFFLAPRIAFILGAGACDYTVKDQRVSPDGRRKAAVVEVDCGATTDYASWVVATDANAPFQYGRDRVSAVNGRALRIAWEGRKLIIYHRPTEPLISGPAKSDPVETRGL